MKSKQINNQAKPTGKPANRLRSADLSPPKGTPVKELIVCTDVRNYSWQVAPLQSLRPLHSGKTNITGIILLQTKLFLLKLNVDKYPGELAH